MLRIKAYEKDCSTSDTYKQGPVNHCTNSALSHVIVHFLEGVFSECGECSWVSAAKPDGVMDALQHSQLTQVYLGWLRLDREGGREGGRERAYF